MKPSHEIIAEKLEDGSYFKEGRQWYSAIYISPISERIFFIILTCVAGLIFIMAVLALLYLLPIKPRIPFVYRAANMFEEVPTMVRLKKPEDPANPAIVRYYLSAYTTMRESYSEDKFLSSRAFVKAYSDPSVFDEYNRLTHPDNPRSPIRRFGRFIDLSAKVQSVRFDRSAQPYKATVQFSTEEIGTSVSEKTNWTATINFFYTDLVERDVIDPKTGHIMLEFDEPTFQVVSYDVTERLAPIGQK